MELHCFANCDFLKNSVKISSCLVKEKIMLRLVLWAECTITPLTFNIRYFKTLTEVLFVWVTMTFSNVIFLFYLSMTFVYFIKHSSTACYKPRQTKINQLLAASHNGFLSWKLRFTSVFSFSHLKGFTHAMKKNVFMLLKSMAVSMANWLIKYFK